MAKILIVDDEEQVRDLFGSYLSKQGHRIVAAASGPEAIGMARRENPDLILLDLMMPEMDGITLCKILKSDEQTRYIPIIMITAYDHQKIEAVAAGAEDYLHKPFEMRQLSARVKSMLRVGNIRDDLQRTVAYLRELEQDTLDFGPECSR
jgi:DNA-binding response OmpR family regulator